MANIYNVAVNISPLESVLVSRRCPHWSTTNVKWNTNDPRYRTHVFLGKSVINLILVSH